MGKKKQADQSSEALSESESFALIAIAETAPCGQCRSRLIQVLSEILDLMVEELAKLLRTLQESGLLADKNGIYMVTPEGWNVYAMLTA